MGVVSMKQLLEAGVHFGHQTRRWNPKMARYIFTERNGIYIIDLQKTVKKLDEAYMFVRDMAAGGGNLLFVGTKKQAGDSVRDEATRAGAYYVNARWLGGMLTNFKTIRRRIDRLAQLRKMQEDGTFELLPKKEVSKLNLEIEKLEKFLGGIKDMKKLPSALFVVDPRKEKIAVAEAVRHHGRRPHRGPPGQHRGRPGRGRREGERNRRGSRRQVIPAFWTNKRYMEVSRMAFTAKDVQALREQTNCGMMDCKKALTEADGDMEKAVEILREKGLAAATK